jgi:hypothetical protein
MTENGSRVATKPLFVSQPCPPSAPCHGATPGAKPTPYDRVQLSNAEAAELVRAKTAADSEVAAARPAIEAATRTLLDRERDATAALHQLDVFTRSGDLAAARDAVLRTRAEHEGDGPEDRRRRPGWARYALWLAVPAAGIYDTTFFATVFLRLVDAAPDLRSLEFYIALLPGLMITAALLTAGHWLAQTLVRARAHSERAPEYVPFLTRVVCVLIRRPATPKKRRSTDLPWPRWVVPVVFAVLVLGTLTVWAHNRAMAVQAKSSSTPTVAVALLLLMFSMTAIAVKVVYYNPFLDSANDAEKNLAKAGKHGDELVTAAGTAVAEFDAANQRLQGLLGDLAAQASRRLDAAWAAILRERHEHGLAGTVAPSFRSNENGAAPTRQTLFADLPEPAIWLGPVHDARSIRRDDEVRTVRDRLSSLLVVLADQRTEESPPRRL